MDRKSIVYLMGGIAVTFVIVILVLLLLESRLKNTDHTFATGVPDNVERPLPENSEVLDGPAIMPAVPAGITGDSIVNYAMSLLGAKYQFASCTPDGFDCSGFVYYVFRQHGIPVSRSSYTMADEGISISLRDARRGDLIFFQGTDLSDPAVGHVGIVITNAGEPLKFIHSSSGKTKNGVIITALSDGNYTERFLKVKRLIGT